MSGTANTQILLEQLCQLLRHCEQQGWCSATGGNYSIKAVNEAIHITRSGFFKGAATPDDFVAIHMNGQPISGTQKVSDETLLHTLIYHQEPQTQAVLHTHSPYGTALSLLNHHCSHLEFTGMEMQKALRGCDSHLTTLRLPLFANNQDIPALANTVQQRWSEVALHAGFYLIGHGLYTWGDSLSTARRHLEGWEFLLLTQYLTQTRIFHASGARV